MAQYCKINGTEYPAIGFFGRMHDEEWDGRWSKTINLTMTYAQAASLFVDGASWSIVERNGNNVVMDEFDNSEFNVAGDITDHRDGTLSIKMGKETDLEEAYELLYGGE